MGNKKELLAQIIDNLTVIKDSKTEFSPIEKDIVLQNLRDAYLLILKDFSRDLEPQGEVFEEDTDIELPDNQKNNIEECAPETVAIPEKEVPVEEEKTIEKPVEEVKAKEETLPIEEVKPEVEPIETKADAEDIDNHLDINQKVDLDEKTKILEDVVLGKINPKEIEHKIEDSEPESSIDEEMDDDILQFVKPYEPAELESKPIAEVKKEENIEPEPEPEPVVKIKPEPVVEPKPESKLEQQLEQKPEKSAEQTLFTLEAEAPKKEQQRSLNDLFNEQKQDNSVGTKFQQAKVTDLTKALSINDKFLFIRELFKNKSEEFSRAIQMLNNCSNIDEAFEVMEGLKKQYFWDSTSSAYLALCDLVRKKF